MNMAMRGAHIGRLYWWKSNDHGGKSELCCSKNEIG